MSEWVPTTANPLGNVTTSDLPEVPPSSCQYESSAATLASQIVVILLIFGSLVFLVAVFVPTIRQALALRYLLKPSTDVVIVEDDWVSNLSTGAAEEYNVRRREEFQRLYDTAPSPVELSGTLSKATRVSFGTIQEEEEEEAEEPCAHDSWTRGTSPAFNRYAMRNSSSAFGTTKSLNLLRVPSLEDDDHQSLHRTPSQEFLDKFHKSMFTGERLDLSEFKKGSGSEDRRRSSSGSTGTLKKKRRTLGDVQPGEWSLHALANSKSFSSNSGEDRSDPGPYGRRHSVSPTHSYNASFNFNEKKPKSSSELSQNPSTTSQIIKRAVDVFGTMGRNSVQFKHEEVMYDMGSDAPDQAHVTPVNSKKTKMAVPKVKKHSLEDLRDLRQTRPRNGSASSEVLFYKRHRRSGVTLSQPRESILGDI
eukprot:maker-scaffold109_size355148-snap-gene-0.12 protein:Tk11019 transcript:maker-scaffold109_size355148-snap-gene-0.12-mRNA-1 annotation:"nad dependent epimerase dehydratase family protein"